MHVHAHRLGSSISKCATVAYDFANLSPQRHVVGSAISEMGTLFRLTACLNDAQAW